ncbi:MAG: hypothetical protein A2139_07830 [Desulfobacca sp. RBG_16_60_12]|nr:MAG: hypothetical protein A2139_07830 [Desulfobacca sp. RBG_16_60_12]
MSQMIPFQQSALPAHLQQIANSAGDNLIAASGTGGGQQVDHISIKGGRFHIVRNGQQPVTLQLFELNVVIVHANPGMTKALFEGAWNPDADAEAPICSSDDGVTPRADSEKPQCGTCAACPQNQFGSKINQQTQKAGKACQDKKTVAVVTPGSEGGEMLRLQIPAASLKEFGAYLRSLPVKYCYVVTQITFDTTVSYPKLLFKPLSYVSAEGVAAIDARHDSQDAKAMAGVAGFTPMGAPAVAAPLALGAPPAHVQQQAPVQAAPVQPTKTPEQLQLEALQAQLAAAQQAIAAQQQAPVQQAPVDTGFGQPQQAPVQQTYQQPVVQPLSSAPAPQDPNVAAIFGGQAQQPVAGAQQTTQAAPSTAQGNVHPSGREYGKPSPGKQRRTKIEMAEDAAGGVGQAAGETSEDDNTPAPVQPQQPAKTQEQLQMEAQVAALQAQLATAQQQQAPAQQAPVDAGFGQAPQQAQQPIQQPANQPQVMTGAVVDAFAGWDD